MLWTIQKLKATIRDKANPTATPPPRGFTLTANGTLRAAMIQQTKGNRMLVVQIYQVLGRRLPFLGELLYVIAKLCQVHIFCDFLHSAEICGRFLQRHYRRRAELHVEPSVGVATGAVYAIKDPLILPPFCLVCKNTFGEVVIPVPRMIETCSSVCFELSNFRIWVMESGDRIQI